MLLKSTVATATLALAASLASATPAHAVDLPTCAAATPSGHTRGTCTFVGLTGWYKVTIDSVGVRYSWSRAECAGDDREVFADVWNTEGGHAEAVGYLSGGTCTLTVAAGESTTVAPGVAVGTVSYRV
jgi:hypothetical protein